MNNILISVIIPLYNKENFIAKTVNSVLNQTFQDFEIIIVEDCSTDTSKSKAYSIVSDKIKIIEHKKNKGLSAARNTGIKAAKSDYIAFLDADDIWKEGFLEKISSLIINFPEAGLYATNYIEQYPNNVFIKPVSNLKKNKITDVIITDFFESSLFQNIYYPSSLCVKKEVFEEVGYYDINIKFGEDIDFNIRANSQYKLAYSFESLSINIMYSDSKMTHSSLKDKPITNFNKYEPWTKKNISLKKYLDFNRYIMANNYKKQNLYQEYKMLVTEINPDSKISGLNYKQYLLLKLPSFVLRLIGKIKRYLLYKGIFINSYN